MAKTVTELLSGNTYPGRGIIIGKTEDGKYTRIVYFIMGRSTNSRNRVFTATDDGIMTEAYDPALLSDPSLIIYHPVRYVDKLTVVTNGDQTDTIANFIKDGKSFDEALMTRTFEPDPPNWTPRISGIVYPCGRFDMSILKSSEGDGEATNRYSFRYENPIHGTGRFISTYMHDGNPLPSFEGEPKMVKIEGSLEDYCNATWNALDNDNKVSLYGCDIEIETGKRTSLIINKNN